VNNQVVILIIAHKQHLTGSEQKSLKQCHDILGKYPIHLICPQGLDTGIYQSVCPEVSIDHIDPKWQSNYGMFNRLKISSFLYDRYSKYKFILFYELDAWVFKDELTEWCDKNYDYIGAPWFEGWDVPKSTDIVGVGNGGFSLRNVESALRINKRIARIKQLRAFWFRSKLQGVWRFEKFLLAFKNAFQLQSIKYLEQIVFDRALQEDYYWCDIVGNTFRDFKVAPSNEAIKFSFEVNPSYLYQENGTRLPFGCHAWEKFQPEFWKAFIS
jgi:hypothetical protein